jgi:sigma-E factor negative regulatory protein RseB
MRIATSPVLLALLLLGTAQQTLADPLQDELKWLETMAFAAHQTNYSGTFVYQYGSHVETSRITHVVDGHGEHGRLEGMDGTRREIIRNNDQVWCYVGDSKVRVEQRGGREFPALLPDQLSSLNENYQIKQAEDVRVAGFHAHAIIFQPKDNLRYAHRMWADSDSGLLLKAEVLDERGAVVEQYAFTQLTIGGNIDQTWIMQDKPGMVPIAQQLAVIHKAATPPKASGWQADAMPTGFRKITEIHRSMHGREAPAIQMVFSDGLAGVSVFIEKMDNDEDDHPGLISQGVIQIYSRVTDEHLITVVGEVPPQTVMQIADSIRYAGE